MFSSLANLMDNLVILKIYHNKYDAETAVGLLKGNGIEAILSSDISLGDNQVLVKKEDLEKAREAIKLLEESLSEEDLKKIGEIAIQEKETPFEEKKSKKDFAIIIPFVIVGVFLFLYVFQGLHTKRYYAGGNFECKQVKSDEMYTVCKEYYNSKKVRWVGIYKRNKADGLAQEFFEDGGLRWEGLYVNNKLDGPYKVYYPNGQLKAEGAFKNNKMEGESREYYETGELKRIAHFKDDLFDGNYKTFYKSGKIAEDIELKNGMRFDAQGKPYEGAEKTFYENGALWEMFNYKNGKLEGVSKIYYENGSLEGEANYHQGKMQGEAKSYYENGNFRFVFQYEKDVPIAVKEYDQEGNIIFQSSYEYYK